MTNENESKNNSAPQNLSDDHREAHLSGTASDANDSARPEHDELLSSEEQQLHQAFAPSSRSLKVRFSEALGRWWKNKPARYATLGVLFAVVLLISCIPLTRYAALNLVGVRGSLQLTILDKTTKQPLQNVQVSMGGAAGKTSARGSVTLTNLQLGNQELVVQKKAFAPSRQQITIGLGATTLAPFSLRATGSQYTFTVKDYVSQKGIASARIIASDDASANTNDSGEAVLSFIVQERAPLMVRISADGYRSENVTIASDAADQRAVTLVPSGRHIFASNQSGSLGVYGVDLDGKNKKEIMGALKTGGQNGLQLKTAPDSSSSALVSKKDGIVNSEGFLLDALTIIDVRSASNKVIDRGESIQILGWSGSKLVYRLEGSGVSAANPSRSKIFSYDTKNSQRIQLASANYFSGEVVIDSVLYYAVSSTDPAQAPAFMQVDLDGKNRQLLAKGIIWGVYRKSYRTITLQNDTGWQMYDTKIHKISKIIGPDYGNFAYEVSGDGTYVMHVQQRDNAGVIIVTGHDSPSEEVVRVDPGAQFVIGLSGGVITYRSAKGGLLADYVVSTSGSAAKKITDVYNSY